MSAVQVSLIQLEYISVYVVESCGETVTVSFALIEGGRGFGKGYGRAESNHKQL